MSDQVAATTRFNDRYVVGEPLDANAMFERFAAVDTTTNRGVLINVLRSTLAADRAFVTDFRSHVQAAAALTHPGFVKILDWGRERGGISDRPGPTVYVVSERIDRPLLAARVAGRGVPVSAAIEVLLACTSAIGYAHRGGVVPVGVSPESIYGGDGTSIRIDQPGFAPLLPIAALTPESARWAAPERLVGHPPDDDASSRPDERSDVYELGLLGYFLLSGVAPFAGDSVAAIAEAHRVAIPDAPSSLNPAVPRALEALLGRCLAKSPADRFSDMGELRAALIRIRESLAPRSASKRESTRAALN